MKVVRVVIVLHPPNLLRLFIICIFLLLMTFKNLLYILYENSKSNDCFIPA